MSVSWTRGHLENNTTYAEQTSGKRPCHRLYPSLDKLFAFLEDVDLVITEGFKRSDYAKVEIVRAARTQQPLCRDDDTLFALVTDTDLNLGVPRFGLEDIQLLADLIENRFL